MVTAFWVIISIALVLLIVACGICYFFYSEDYNDGAGIASLICGIAALIVAGVMIAAGINVRVKEYTRGDYDIQSMAHAYNAATRIDKKDKEYLKHTTLWGLEQWTYYIPEDYQYNDYKINAATSDIYRIEEVTVSDIVVKGNVIEIYMDKDINNVTDADNPVHRIHLDDVDPSIVMVGGEKNVAVVKCRISDTTWELVGVNAVYLTESFAKEKGFTA